MKSEMVGIIIFLLFVVSLLYLFEYSESVKLTFQYYEELKELKQIAKRVEELRIKEVTLSGANRIYRLTH